MYVLDVTMCWIQGRDAAMRIQWLSPIRHFAKHAFKSSAVFCILTVVAVVSFGIVTLAERVITSRFIIYVLTFLEYSILVADSGVAIVLLVDSVREYMKGTRQ